MRATEAVVALLALGILSSSLVHFMELASGIESDRLGINLNNSSNNSWGNDSLWHEIFLRVP